MKKELEKHVYAVLGAREAHSEKTLAQLYDPDKMPANLREAHHELDLDLMNEACKILFEYTDFECFSKVNTEVNTFNCKISEAHWKQSGNQLIFTITADRFLRNMVRAIVGTMVNIGLGKIEVADLRTIIESKNRGKAGFSVPAHGLYLVNVRYPYIEDRK